MSLTSASALFGQSLVVVQIALSVLVLVGAGLFVHTLANLRSLPIGFNPQRILLFDLDPPHNHFAGAARIALFRRIEEKLSALSGIQSATLSSEPLLADSMDNNCVRPTGQPPGKPGQDSPFTNNVGERFFETLEIPIIAGRSFNWHDNQHAPRVAIANRKLVQKFFPNSGALGKTVSFCEATDPPIEIVGIAADARYANIDQDAPPTLYLPYLQQDDAWDVTFEIKTAASTESVVKLIRTALDSVDRDLPILDIRTQNQQIDAALTEQRMFASLTSGFGLLALLLAGIGIYGIMAYNVSRRTNEIGIRMALGADRVNVVQLVLRGALLRVGLGLALGLPLAIGAGRLIANQLYGVEFWDPIALTFAAVSLALCAMLAAFIPASFAASISPMTALRTD
jgi:predicted permease